MALADVMQAMIDDLIRVARQDGSTATPADCLHAAELAGRINGDFPDMPLGDRFIALEEARTWLRDRTQ